jgi:hypothetical protein
MAQVTMSGAMAYRFQSQESSTGVGTHGVGVSDAYVTFATSEDLGGGLKLSAVTGIDLGAGEDKASQSPGVTMSLATASMGSVVFSSEESGDYLPMGNADLVTTGGHNGSNADRITYVSPSFNGVTLSYTYQDGTGIIDGPGAHGVGQTVSVTDIDYSAGPLTVGYRTVGTDAELNTALKKASGYKASYDFGVAKVAMGAYKLTAPTTYVVTKQTAFQVTAPVGPIALTVSLGSEKIGTAAKYDSNQISATYALSKRTNVNLDLVKWDSSTTTASPQRTRMTLTHSF